MRYLGILLVIGLVVYTVVDVLNSDDDDRHGVPRGLWVFGMIALPPIGSIVWLVLRFARRSGGRGPVPNGGAGPGGRPPYRSRPVAPDDDPEFLWRLEQERRRREREGRTGEREGHTDDEPGSPLT